MNLETIRSSFDLKIRSGMFKPITRRLHADMAEDRAQEGLALTYEIYRQHALQGDVLDNALLVCLRPSSVRKTWTQRGSLQRQSEEVLRDGREELPRGQGRDAAPERHPGGPAKRGERARACRGPSGEPGAQNRLGIDLQAWLAELSAEDRQLLSMRMAGCGWNEIGERTRHLGLNRMGTVPTARV